MVDFSLATLRRSPLRPLKAECREDSGGEAKIDYERLGTCTDGGSIEPGTGVRWYIVYVHFAKHMRRHFL